MNKPTPIRLIGLVRFRVRDGPNVSERVMGGINEGYEV